MLYCNACRVSYETLLFSCPSCGAALISCTTDQDTVVFRSGDTWREIRAITIGGVIQTRVTNAVITPRGFEVTSSQGLKGQISLSRLYESLTTPAQVIEL
jgi:hypothetical protein